MQDDIWQDIIRIEELFKADVTPVEYDGIKLAVYDTDRGVSVSAAQCTHAGANLCDGYFDGQFIECPLHQGLFNASTGEAKAAPVVRALKMYESRLFEGKVQIKL